MDLNKAMIIGRLTRDPEVRTTPSGITVTSMSVATGYSWKDQSGNSQDKTEYHNVVLWRKLGEIAGQYLNKGRRVYIEGRLETRNWEGQDGVKRYRTEIIADSMIMLDGPRGSGNNPNPADNSGAPLGKPPVNDAADEIKVEDIPF